jgi:V-type H+-transporting ATPase subunit E
VHFAAFHYPPHAFLQTDHDFNLEKQNLVHAGKLKVQEEYAQKEKDLEVEQRV